jgi:2-iminoacetate synthase ThiH
MQDESSPALEPLQPGEDFYYDGPYMVFTAQYHLKRGTCCNSGCRHCPYRSKAGGEKPDLASQ